MEAYPIYKCRRCGATVVGKKITDPQEYGAVEPFTTHECETIGGEAGEAGTITKVGLCKLVGYDEYDENELS